MSTLPPPDPSKPNPPSARTLVPGWTPRAAERRLRFRGRAAKRAHEHRERVKRGEA